MGQDVEARGRGIRKILSLRRRYDNVISRSKIPNGLCPSCAQSAVLEMLQRLGGRDKVAVM